MDAACAQYSNNRRSSHISVSRCAVVEAAGMTMGDVVKITNFLLDVRDYPAMAAVRQQYLAEPYPASTMVQVSGFLYQGLLVEIEGIAVAR